METLKDVLDEKGRQVWSVRPWATVLEALELMAEKNIGAVLVTDEDGQLVGVFSERDYARRTLTHQEGLLSLPVRELMTQKVTCALSHRSIDECMALMTHNRIRHLPVLEDGAIAGVVSIGDVVKAEIAEREFVIDQLEHYISGSL